MLVLAVLELLELVPNIVLEVLVDMKLQPQLQLLLVLMELEKPVLLELQVLALVLKEEIMQVLLD